MVVTKTIYAKGMNCQKRAWLGNNFPAAITPMSTEDNEKARAGNAVGKLAWDLYPNGVLIEFNSSSFSDMANKTSKLIEGGVSIIYEATFIFKGMVVMIDIVKNTKEGLELIEVKSGTSLKDNHVQETEFQHYIVRNSGHTISASQMLFVDSTYKRIGAFNIKSFFKHLDVFNNGIINDETGANIERIKAMLLTKEEPEVEIGKHCKNPNCDAFDYCWGYQRGITEPSIFNIFNIGTPKQKALYDAGIVKINDIPNNFEMTVTQNKKVSLHKQKKEVIQVERIKDFLGTLTYPIYHLDFETYQQVIPEWDNVSPYEQLVFQYSLHIEEKDGTIIHKDFLGEAGADPREALCNSLVENIPLGVTTLAYNMSFEKKVIKGLALLFPYHAKALLDINEGMKDLMVPFRENAWYSPKFKGKYSLKAVLPALCPDMKEAYKLLDGIHNGAEAMGAYAKLQNLRDEEEIDRVRKGLLEYCKLDTLAMVKVLEVVKKASI